MIMFSLLRFYRYYYKLEILTSKTARKMKFMWGSVSILLTLSKFGFSFAKCRPDSSIAIYGKNFVFLPFADRKILVKLAVQAKRFLLCVLVSMKIALKMSLIFRSAIFYIYFYSTIL